MKALNASKLRDLILARLSVRTKRTVKAKELADSLEPLVAGTLSASEWRQSLARGLEELQREGHVAREALRLTEQGVARVCELLKLDAPPSAKTWREFKAKYLPRLFLQVSELPADVNVEPGAAVLAERLGVPLTAKLLGRRAKLEQVRARVVDAWLARAYGLPSGKVTLPELRAALLAREIGLHGPGGAGATSATPRARRVLRDTLTKLADAPSQTSQAITQRLTARWLFEEQDAQRRPPLPESAAPPVSEPKQSEASSPERADTRLHRIVAKVRRAAAGSGLRQFGPNKIFIASIWEALANDPEVSSLGEAGFKDLLAEAHRRGLLLLSRADLVAAMDPGDVAASETRHQNATYHFIQREALA